MDEIKERDVEGHWETKEKKLVWRGKLSFAPKLRRALLAIAKDKPWSAVRALRWWDKKSMQNDFVSSVDQCNYMFIAHAEGWFSRFVSQRPDTNDRFRKELFRRTQIPPGMSLRDRGS